MKRSSKMDDEFLTSRASIRSMVPSSEFTLPLSLSLSLFISASSSTASLYFTSIPSSCSPSLTVRDKRAGVLSSSLSLLRSFVEQATTRFTKSLPPLRPH